MILVCTAVSLVALSWYFYKELTQGAAGLTVFEMNVLAALVVSLALGARAQLNPLGRFGKCIHVDTQNATKKDLEGLWYMQYRFENPDHEVHSCQAQYEQPVKDYLSSLLYYYNKGSMVKAPQSIKYREVSPGVLKRGITVDNEPVYVYVKVLRYDPIRKYRLIYLCTDNAKANPDIFNVDIATREQEPDNLSEVLASAKAVLKTLPSQLDVNLEKVYQKTDRCEPLTVTKKSIK